MTAAHAVSPRSTLKRGVTLGLTAGLFALLAACGDLGGDGGGPDFDITAPRDKPVKQVEIRAVESLELPSTITDITLMPNAAPWNARALAALEGGGLMAIDLAFVETKLFEMPEAASLAAAETFQLRGQAAPLLFAAGGEHEAPKAYVFLAEDGGALLEAPMEPITPSFDVDAVCVLRQSPGAIDLALAGFRELEIWRVRDDGGDVLSVEKRDGTSISPAARVCAENAADSGIDSEGGAVTLAPGARPQLVNDLGGALVADAATLDVNGPLIRLAALAERGRLALVEGETDAAAIEFTIAGGLNTSGASAPGHVVGSSRNFGGTFGDGVVLVAQGEQISLLALETVLDLATEARRSDS